MLGELEVIVNLIKGKVDIRKMIIILEKQFPFELYYCDKQTAMKVTT